MVEENGQVEENGAEEMDEDVEMVYEGEAPNDLSDVLEVSAKATVKSKEGGVSGYKGATGYYPFGKDLPDAVQKFGEAIVFSNFRAQAKIKLQSLMRGHLLAGKDVGELLKTWKPGIQMERTPVDPLVAAENKFDRLSPEEQQAFLAKLMAKQAG